MVYLLESVEVPASILYYCVKLHGGCNPTIISSFSRSQEMAKM